MTVEETLAGLVRIDTRSSRTNVEFVNHVAPLVEAAGLCARLLPYTDEQGVKKIQMIAVAPRTTGDDDEIGLALVGHTDTVPFDANWTDALTLTERDGKLYGRGACDTKAFIAATLSAVEAV